MLTLISYDIADDGDRARAHKLLEGLGQRVQYSVFECYLEPEVWIIQSFPRISERPQ